MFYYMTLKSKIWFSVNFYESSFYRKLWKLKEFFLYICSGISESQPKGHCYRHYSSSPEFQINPAWLPNPLNPFQTCSFTPDCQNILYLFYPSPQLWLNLNLVQQTPCNVWYLTKSVIPPRHQTIQGPIPSFPPSTTIQNQTNQLSLSATSNLKVALNIPALQHVRNRLVPKYPALIPPSETSPI